MNANTNERQILIWRKREEEKKKEENRAGSVWGDHVHKIYSEFVLLSLDLARLLLFWFNRTEYFAASLLVLLDYFIWYGEEEGEWTNNFLAAQFGLHKTISRCWSDVLRVLVHEDTHTYRQASAGNLYSRVSKISREKENMKITARLKEIGTKCKGIQAQD